MSINRLMINSLGVETHEYIAQVFWNQRIAKVSSITLMPYFKKGKLGYYNMAYINIAEWCDNEAAYNFIQRLKDPSKEARIYHYIDNWWPVEINTHNSGVGEYTVTFGPDYFMWFTEDEMSVTEDEDEELLSSYDDEELHHYSPIECIFEHCFSPEETDEQLWYLESSRKSGIDMSALAEELCRLETEKRIEYAAQHSQNVTLGSRQKPYWYQICPSEMDVVYSDMV